MSGNVKKNLRNGFFKLRRNAVFYQALLKTEEMMLQCCIYLALIDIVGTLSTSGIKNQSYFILSYTVCTHLNFKGFLEDKICFFKLETWIRQPPDFGHRPRPGGPDQRKQLSAACCNKEKKIQELYYIYYTEATRTRPKKTTVCCMLQ